MKRAYPPVAARVALYGLFPGMTAPLPLFLKLGSHFDTPFELPGRDFRQVSLSNVQVLGLRSLHSAYDAAGELGADGFYLHHTAHWENGSHSILLYNLLP